MKNLLYISLTFSVHSKRRVNQTGVILGTSLPPFFLSLGTVFSFLHQVLHVKNGCDLSQVLL